MYHDDNNLFLIGNKIIAEIRDTMAMSTIPHPSPSQACVYTFCLKQEYATELELGMLYRIYN